MAMLVLFALQKMEAKQRLSLNTFRGPLAAMGTTRKIEGVIMPIQFSIKKQGIKHRWRED